MALARQAIRWEDGTSKACASKVPPRRLREHAQDVWRFASHALVPFTNNAAEQLMRMLKVKLKIAGSFRTEAGADVFCAIRSYLATMLRQGHSAFECLTLVLQGQTPQPRLG